MITIQKLPSLEPEMRGVLRNHIMRKRQRLKQELEQDAIEKRMKKEREQKRIQDAMTLDQIKEQLTTLEKKLETLRDEKHNLFVQLKQVLNEGNTKRKQSSETNTTTAESSVTDEQAKRPKTTDGNATANATATDTQAANGVSPETSEPPTTAVIPTATTSTRIPVMGSSIETIGGKPIPMSQESRISELNLTLKSISQPRHKPSHSELPTSRPSLPQASIRTGTQQQHSTDMKFASQPPHLPISHSFTNNQIRNSDMVNMSREDNMPPISSHSMSPQQLAALQAHLRGPFGGPSLSGHMPPELLIASRTDPNFSQKFGAQIGLHHRLPLASMPQDVTSNLTQGPQQAEASKMLSELGHAPRGGPPGLLDMNGLRWDERLLALKKGSANTTAPFHPGQLLLDGSPSLAHFNLLNQATLSGNINPATSIGHSLSSLGPNNPQSPIDFNGRKLSSQGIPQSGVDFFIGQMRPGGMLIPSLGPLYTPQQPGTSLGPPTSIYGPSGLIDLEHLNALYHPSLSQHMAESMTHFNNSVPRQQQQQHHQRQQLQLDQQHLQSLHRQQQDEASRLFSSSNYHRKPAPKNPYR